MYIYIYVVWYLLPSGFGWLVGGSSSSSASMSSSGTVYAVYAVYAVSNGMVRQGVSHHCKTLRSHTHAHKRKLSMFQETPCCTCYICCMHRIRFKCCKATGVYLDVGSCI